MTEDIAKANVRQIDVERGNFDALRGVSRDRCSGGHRHFNIMSDGSVYRCVELFYSGRSEPIGNISNLQGIRALTLLRDRFAPCVQGTCFLQCDGYKTEQKIDSFLDHVGWDIDHYGLRGKNYCILQVHMTSFCNWKCSYCCAEQWMSKKTPNLPANVWRESAELFVSRYDCGALLLMGGEPTVHKGWSEYCMVFVNAGWNVRIVTNFSLHAKLFEFVNKVPENLRSKFLINISLHPTQWKNGFDEFEAGMKRIADIGGSMCCTIVDTESNREAVEEHKIEERCRKMPILWFDWIKEL